MPNNYFQFKRFTIQQERCNMKVCTDSCLFGAWVASKIEQELIKPETVLDVGAGTGLLSLMLAQKSAAKVHAVDIDANSFAQASENFDASPWNERLQAFHADIKTWEAPATYDLIIANPPFYENDLAPDDNGKLIAKHAGSMGLKGLLVKAKHFLNEDGIFAVLLPYQKSRWFENAATAYSFFVKEKADVKQTAGHDYFRTMLLLQNQRTCIVQTGLGIKRNNNEYTDEFIELLKDYYLYL